MKSIYESREHSQIHTVKDQLRKEARAYQKSGEIGGKLTKIIDQNAEHARIQAEKIALDERNGCPIKKSKQAPKTIKNTVETPGELVARIMTNDLSGSERRKIREIAGVIPLYNAERDGVVVMM